LESYNLVPANPGIAAAVSVQTESNIRSVGFIRLRAKVRFAGKGEFVKSNRKPSTNARYFFFCIKS